MAKVSKDRLLLAHALRQSARHDLWEALICCLVVWTRAKRKRSLVFWYLEELGHSIYRRPARNQRNAQRTHETALWCNPANKKAIQAEVAGVRQTGRHGSERKLPIRESYWNNISNFIFLRLLLAAQGRPTPTKNCRRNSSSYHKKKSLRDLWEHSLKAYARRFRLT